MTYNQYVDHTLLKANATQEELLKLCDEAVVYSLEQKIDIVVEIIDKMKELGIMGDLSDTDQLSFNFL